jgi:hypothetical protein
VYKVASVSSEMTWPEELEEARGSSGSRGGVVTAIPLRHWKAVSRAKRTGSREPRIGRSVPETGRGGRRAGRCSHRRGPAARRVPSPAHASCGSRFPLARPRAVRSSSKSCAQDVWRWRAAGGRCAEPMCGDRRFASIAPRFACHRASQRADLSTGTGAGGGRPERPILHGPCGQVTCAGRGPP